MTIVLIEEREEPLVVAWGHSEQLDELPIAALRLLQSGLNQLPEIGLGEFAIDECRIDDGPEALAADDHAIPKHFRARLRRRFSREHRIGLRERLAVDDFFRQFIGANLATSLPNHETLHHVLQLADVARPPIRGQDFLSVWRHARCLDTVRSRGLLKIVLKQKSHVAAAFAQRRNHQANHVQTVVEIFAEFLLVDAFEQVAVRRGNNPDVDVAFAAIGTDALDFTGLHEAEQHRLHAQRHLAKFVEEQRAAMRHHIQARFVAVRAGEASADVAKQLRLEQGVGQSGAVDRDEVARLARTRFVNEPRDDFFPDAGFSDDQYLRVRARSCANVLVDAGHLRALPYQRSY